MACIYFIQPFLLNHVLKRKMNYIKNAKGLALASWIIIVIFVNEYKR